MIAADKLRDCVHCGLCLNACPTYLELGTEMDSPRGRIYLMEKLATHELSLSPDVVRHFDLCLGCRACESACPSGVRYGELIESARAHVEEHHHRGRWDALKRRLIAAVFPYPARLRLALAPLRLLERIGLLAWIRRYSQAAAMLPDLTHTPSASRVAAPAGTPRGRVALFSGCVNQVLFDSTNAATERVLRRNRYEVETPAAQGCCGALHLHAGDEATAKRFAIANLSAFHGEIDAIVVNAAGCGAMLKDYGRLLADDPVWAGRAAALSACVKDISELLTPMTIDAPRAAMPQRVTYHDACHLAHAQGVKAAPRALLGCIPGVELSELTEAEVCCGSAGSYNLTEPELSRRLGDRKAEHIAATGADCVAVGNPGCALQIRASLQRRGSGIQVLHPIELLDQAYSRGETPPE